MKMPGLDWAVLTLRLRQLEEQLPVLGKSGLTERLEVEHHENLPLATLLAKPFLRVTLLAACMRFCGRPKLLRSKFRAPAPRMRGRQSRQRLKNHKNYDTH
jgi:hypothetical protein